ncbi:MAG: conserved exported protein of unknown function [Nitrospira sp.]|nr:MAG: conserved exported protein of unknown function [Nitrospira sp.]
MRPVLASLLVIALLMSVAHAEAAKKRPRVVHRTGVEPFKNGECPDEHPIKGNFTTYSGERCIYHMIGQRFYLRTKAERCYATEAEAIQDGCRRSKV